MLSIYFPMCRKCALCGQTKTCKHRIKFGDSSSYYYVSPFCRYRVSITFLSYYSIHILFTNGRTQSCVKQMWIGFTTSLFCEIWMLGFIDLQKIFFIYFCFIFKWDQHNYVYRINVLNIKIKCIWLKTILPNWARG